MYTCNYIISNSLKEMEGNSTSNLLSYKAIAITVYCLSTSYRVIKLKKVSRDSIVQNLPFFSKLYPPCKHFISKVILSSRLYGFLFWVLQTNHGEEPISYLKQYYNQHFNIHVLFCDTTYHLCFDSDSTTERRPKQMVPPFAAFLSATCVLQVQQTGTKIVKELSTLLLVTR